MEPTLVHCGAMVQCPAMHNFALSLTYESSTCLSLALEEAVFFFTATQMVSEYSLKITDVFLMLQDLI